MPEWVERMHLGKFGIWTTALDYQPAAGARRAAGELDEMGFGAIWIGEARPQGPAARAVAGAG